jgi:hypothetical protein
LKPSSLQSMMVAMKLWQTVLEQQLPKRSPSHICLLRHRSQSSSMTQGCRYRDGVDDISPDIPIPSQIRHQLRRQSFLFQMWPQGRCARQQALGSSICCQRVSRRGTLATCSSWCIAQLRHFDHPEVLDTPRCVNKPTPRFALNQWVDQA